MIFLRSNLPALFSPLTLVFLLLVVAMCRRQWRRGGRVAAVLLLCVGGYGWAPNGLHNSLARRYPVAEAGGAGCLPDAALAKADGQLARRSLGETGLAVGRDERAMDIVVLAAGSVSEDESLPITARVGAEWLNRFTEGVRLYRSMPESRLWVSLSGTDDVAVAHRQLAELAVVFELDLERLRPLLAARNTADEARLARVALDPAQPFYLVTSDYHMPRAMLLFRQAGLHPQAAPAVSEPGLADASRGRFSIWPRASNMMRMDRALREYMGMAWAKAVKR